MTTTLNLSINQDRLLHRIDRLSQFSDAPPPAVTRILFTPTEIIARDYIKSLFSEAGLSVRVDAVGNIFGRWMGREPDLPAVATGSHIDAIPHSGRYDGTVGVLGGLEAIHALKQAGFQPRRSLELLMFTAEEPTRFGIGCLGSRALSGALTVADMRGLRDEKGRRFDEIRQTLGGCATDLETVQLDSDFYSHFVELHIEQGPHLEAANIPIGVVTSIAAPATLRVTLTGEGGHAGAVLMPDRRDALLAGAEIALAVEKAALDSSSPDSVATTGLFKVYPGAVNSIPSLVTLEIDMRDTNLSTRDQMLDTVQTAIQRISQERDIAATPHLLNVDPPAQAHPDVVQAIQTATEQLNIAHLPMVSRAYHDALFMAQICPTGMIFVPSANGYSHRPEEYTSPEELERGVHVLALTLAQLAG